MQSELQRLSGQQILDVYQGEGVRLQFPEASLVILNPITYYHEGVAATLAAPSELRGLCVDKIMESDLEASLILSNSSTLQIDLRAESYTGPEAMILSFINGGSIIVW